MAPTSFYHQRPHRNLTIADWMTPASRSRLIAKPAVSTYHPPHQRQPSPTPSAPPPRIVEVVKEPEHDMVSPNGRGRWKSTPKDKHVVRMYISAAVSVFAEVMRPSLEIKTSRLFSSFSETVDAILPYWDRLEPRVKAAWARRARDTNKKDHYIYLRAARPEKGKEDLIKKRKCHLDADEDGCETDPDELPGVVCEAKIIEEEAVEKKGHHPQWVSGFLPKKRVVVE